jgi:hypothetical protein
MKDSFSEADIPDGHAPLEPKAGEPAAPVEKKGQTLLRRALRWLLILLLVFGLGALLAIFALYLPARSEIETIQVELQKANQNISEQEQRIASLRSLETKNQELQRQMDDAALHVSILKARSDVSAALLALAKDDPAKSRMALSKTSRTIDGMGSLLDANQQKLIEDMQARLKLATSEIGSNAFAAESDLNVLSTSLMELENSYFTGP